jgi:hypothetical protein
MQNRLSEAVDQFIQQVASDAGVEAVWLSSLAHLEEVASQTILKSLSEATPAQERAEILSHAADEHRHGLEIRAMIPQAACADRRYRDLEAKMHKIAGNFIMGYFGNPVLVAAKNKHAAYVHSALTIEQFPLQIYTAYLKATRLASVKRGLPKVLRDERDHLALGARLRKQLSQAEHLSLEALQGIEEDMCLKMIQRMNAVVLEFLGKKEQQGESSFSSSLSSSDGATVAWIHALGQGEAIAATHMQMIFSLRGLPQPGLMASHVADEMRHCQLMQLSVSGLRRKLLQSPGYVELERALSRGIESYLSTLFAVVLREFKDPELIYHYGALALETRVFRHYQDIIATTDHIGASHALSAILVEEAEHTAAALAALRARGESLKSFDLIRHKEAQLFERTCRNAGRLMQAYSERYRDPQLRLAAAI